MTPVIPHGKHPVTKLIIRAEHHHLLHAGPTLLTSSLNPGITLLVDGSVSAPLLDIAPFVVVT